MDSALHIWSIPDCSLLYTPESKIFLVKFLKSAESDVYGAKKCLCNSDGACVGGIAETRHGEKNVSNKCAINTNTRFSQICEAWRNLSFTVKANLLNFVKY